MREHGLPKPVHKCGDCGDLGHHKGSKKCAKVQKKGKFIDMSVLEEKYMSNTESGTDCSVDSDLSEVDPVRDEKKNDDMEIELDGLIDDFELEEAVEDMAMESPVKQSEMDID